MSDISLLENPFAAIDRDPPQVWLRSFYGFAPEDWGFIGFTERGVRDSFYDQIDEGALVVIYGATKSPNPKHRGRVLGIQQQSKVLGHARDFMKPEAWEIKSRDADANDKWNYAIQAVAAWKVVEEGWPMVADLLPETYSPDLGRAIGRSCKRLTSNDAARLLDLNIYEDDVYGGNSVDRIIEGQARDILQPSKAGPVSQKSFSSKEAEGPKHIYVLRCDGNESHLLGEAVEDEIVVKVGFSGTPRTRCRDHNRTLPSCAFRWKVLWSTADEGREPFDCSKRAMAGERAMIDALKGYGRSLGGEFFRASAEHVEAAFRRGIRASENWDSGGDD